MPSPGPHTVHMIPTGEDHDLAPHCRCNPFSYTRVVENSATSYEIRHNSFHALPVDEEALEKAQGVDRHHPEDDIVGAPASAAVEDVTL